ncbi:MAG TPA: inositol monophosphatase [Gammaproteobacteria bacterium]|jgi:myo-inositol-1(or 4)-monophosphatase|nr:inositol monophosphatase [Gammaproteobacteria bacterium]
MHPMLNIAVRAARNAGRIINRHVGHIDNLSVDLKQRNDFVTDVDRQAEAEIIATLHRAYPDHAFLAEESGQRGESDYVWIIDPLDGTTNFIHGFPQFAVSIALQHNQRLEHAVIYNPASDELFTASRGQGAELNNRRLRVSRQKLLSGSLIGTGFPYRDDQNLERYLDTFRQMVSATAGVRRPGAAALDLAYVAAGRLDGFWEMGLKPWDIAAGALMIREAGGLVGNLRGEEGWLDSGNIVAGNPKVFHAMLQLLKPSAEHYD